MFFVLLIVVLKDERCAMHDVIAESLREIVSYGTQEPFHLVDLAQLHLRVDMWRTCLPRVELFYAVKCNWDPVILESLVKLGVNFDCASPAEIESILQFNVDPERIM